MSHLRFCFGEPTCRLSSVSRPAEFGRAPNGPWRVGDLCTCRPNRKQPSAKWFYPAVSTSEGEGAAPRSVGIYHRLNCVNRRYPIGVSIGAVAARPETDFWVNGARAGRGRERACKSAAKSFVSRQCVANFRLRSSRSRSISIWDTEREGFESLESS